MIVPSTVHRVIRVQAGHPAFFLLILLLAPALAPANQEQAKPEAGPPAAAQAKADTKPAEYVGSETCQTCHEDIFKAFAKNPHEVVETHGKRNWKGKACESCHGPGSKHAESADAADIISFKSLQPDQADQRCLQCHLNGKTNVGRILGSHARNQVACTACHSIHLAMNNPEPRAALPNPIPFTDPVLKRPNAQGRPPLQYAVVNQLCAGCHTSVWQDFQRPHKHPLDRNAMSCVDCHNPHGTFLRSSIQTFAANEPGCYKCHGEKRGPFIYEHAPVRLEGCSTCHEPHGSANPRMLNRAQVMFQCLECHSNVASPQPQAGTIGGIPPAFHDLRSPRFRNCTICHVKIHGSNVSPVFTR